MTPIPLSLDRGHKWILSAPIKTSKSFFMYKYVTLDESGGILYREAGIERLVDLDIVP
jgi:hypothetical protein